MKNKKKLLIAGASAASLAALGLGAFAFFTDTVELTQNAKVGNIELTVNAEMSHTQLTRSNALKLHDNIYEGFNLPNFPSWQEENNDTNSKELTRSDLEAMFEPGYDNINPGDNKGSDSSINEPGTDHEIVVNVTNEGSKSVQTRILFEITGEAADGTQLTENQLEHFKIYLDRMNSMSGLTSVNNNNEFVPNKIFDSRRELDLLASDDENKVVYGLSPYAAYADDYTGTEFGQIYLNDFSLYLNSQLVLSGNSKHNNAEIEKTQITCYENEYNRWGYFETTQKIEDIPSNGSLKFDISLDNGMYYDYSQGFDEIDDEALAEIAMLQNAKIEIKVIVQGIQFRNSNDMMWETLFEQSFLV